MKKILFLLIFILTNIFSQDWAVYPVYYYGNSSHSSCLKRDDNPYDHRTESTTDSSQSCSAKNKPNEADAPFYFSGNIVEHDFCVESGNTSTYVSDFYSHTEVDMSFCTPPPPCPDGFLENSDGVCQPDTSNGGDGGCHSDGTRDPASTMPIGYIFYGSVYPNTCSSHVDNVKYTDSFEFALMCDNATYCALKVADCSSLVGYHLDSSNKCVPDIDCPFPMVFRYINVDWDFDTKGCFPDSVMSQSDCDFLPNSVYLSLSDSVSDELNQYATIFGVGCSNTNYLNDKMSNANLNFLVSGLLPNSMYVGKALGLLFTSGKNWVSNLIKGFTESPNNPTLLLDKPNVIDMKIADDGVFYQVEPTPLDPTAPVDTTTQAYNQYLKDNGFIADTPDNLPAPTADFPTSNVNKDFYYQGGDATDFKDNMIATANQADKGALPDLAPLDNLPNNTQAQTTIKLFEDYTQTVQKDFPVTITKTGSHPDGDNIKTDYVGDVHLPDGSSNHITLTKTEFPDGHSLNEVHTTTEVPTASGTKIFNTYYVTTTNSSGDVTNVTNEGSTIITNGADGSTTTTTNQPSGDSVTTSEQSPAIDLTPAIRKLDNIDNSIKDLNQKFDDMMNYKPANANEADATIQEFNVALNAFDVNFNDYLDYLNNLKQTFLDLKSQFEDAINTFQNKPQIQEITGQCGFNAHFYHEDYFVDPCKFVTPYRSMLALFFTLVGSLQAVGFAVKYLVRS